jgi:hypothetical protein
VSFEGTFKIINLDFSQPFHNLHAGFLKYFDWKQWAVGHLGLFSICACYITGGVMQTFDLDSQ